MYEPKKDVNEKRSIFKTKIKCLTTDQCQVSTQGAYMSYISHFNQISWTVLIRLAISNRLIRTLHFQVVFNMSFFVLIIHIVFLMLNHKKTNKKNLLMWRNSSTDFYQIGIYGKLRTRHIRLYMNCRPQYKTCYYNIEIISKFQKKLSLYKLFFVIIIHGLYLIFSLKSVSLFEATSCLST